MAIILLHLVEVILKIMVMGVYQIMRVSARHVEEGRNFFEKEYNLTKVYEVLNILTRHELSIFRNYMFARHNFAFRTQTWNNFFREHYRSNYNGTRSNDEVMSIMTEWEKDILNMIIEIENQRL